MKQSLLSSPEKLHSEKKKSSTSVSKHKFASQDNKMKDDEQSKAPFTVVAIGASAGGLEAMTKLLKNLSPTTGMAYIYVQHLSPDHESILTSLLSKSTNMKVHDVENMDKILPNNVYVIPYNKEIKVTDGHIELLPRLQGNNLSIDILFSSLATTHKEYVIGIVLSGSASDGTIGLKDIKMAGGITFAQDNSAKYSSMPQSAIAEGIVDFVMSPEQIANKLNWISKHPRQKHIVKINPEDEIDNNDPHLKNILQFLLSKKNIDFNQYKMNTIKRRILRRMLIKKVTTLKEYNEILYKKSNEIDLLYQDLLINVTEFFRDPEAFLLLKNSILPRLLKDKTKNIPLRIWVAACATGEEVYSIAMLLFEIQDSKNVNIPFQIFASDLSAEAINQARLGEYSKSKLENVSPKRLQRFFTKSQDKYRISKTLRDLCIFATHNILRDPPFSRMDFISCRNMLIYLDTSAQKKIIATFHYALNENGCLMLGKSETIGTSLHLFTTPLNKKFKIYTRKNNSNSHSISEITSRILQTTTTQMNNQTSSIPKKNTTTTNGNLGSAFDTYLLMQHVPASVVINHDLEILQFRGATSSYLQNSSGKASFNILKMANIEITFELRNAIHHAIKTKKTVRKIGIEMNRKKTGTAIRIVDIEVSPLKIDGEDELLVIVFSGVPQTEFVEQITDNDKTNTTAKDRRIKKLEEEIAAARSDMASITQDQEAANEELQSANEEIVSSNEELQSLNEELETSKEEIESTNEELITTNQELQVRNQQVEELYSYHETILSTIHEPMLILDKDLRIKSANKSFCTFFQISDDESKRTLLYKLGNGEWNIPRLRKLLDEIVPKNNHFEGYEVEHMFPNIGNKIMLLNAHRIIQQSNKEELIVLAFTDITDVRKLANALQLKEKKEMELKLDIKKKALQRSNERNDELIEAKTIAELRTQIAEDAVKAKQQFLSNMSHEIRTPMNAIIGFTNVVLKTKLDETQMEYLNAIKVSGDSLIILINDILDLAKVNAGKMAFEKSSFDLENSIDLMLQLFELKILEKNVRLIKIYDNRIPPILIGDAMRLRQIILNLFSNAVKFTNKGSITINVCLAKEDDEKITLEFTIIDTGIGIAKEKLEYIFNSFEQASKDTSRSFGGTGLGLAIVKQLVELQGGTIILKSEFGIGSTFGFIMSFEKTKTALTHENIKKPEYISKIDLKGKVIKNVNVLVAEDIPLNQLLIKIILLDFGFKIDIVENGKLAIEHLQKNKYDIILMDLQMPELNGFEATAFIRHEMNSQIPIIALTADVTTVDIGKCLSVGMNDYISKPIDEEILYHKIVKYVKR